MIPFSENKNCTLPLFGYFCCRLAVEPECINSDIYAGIIDINGQKYWARLRNFSIKTWLSRESEDEEKNVIHNIPIDKVSSNLIAYISIFMKTKRLIIHSLSFPMSGNHRSILETFV